MSKRALVLSALLVATAFVLYSLGVSEPSSPDNLRRRRRGENDGENGEIAVVPSNDPVDPIKKPLFGPRNSTISWAAPEGAHPSCGRWPTEKTETFYRDTLGIDTEHLGWQCVH
jgi:hypothetical protein